MRSRLVNATIPRLPSMICSMPVPGNPISDWLAQQSNRWPHRLRRRRQNSTGSSFEALVDGEVLQVNVRPGEFVGAPANQALVVLGSTKQLNVRVDIDEYDIPRFVATAPARATLKGHADPFFSLRFVRIEPYVIPKKSLTGDNTERVDTRVLQVIYAIDAQGQQFFVGQQVDVFIDVGPQNTGTPVAEK